MGQKIDPRGFRLAVTRDWSSKWFASSSAFPGILLEDIKIRTYLNKKFGRKASIGRILIERPAKSIKVTLFTARPGVIIGKKGEGIEQIKVELQKITALPLHLNVEEIRKPELNSQIVADQIAVQLEKRIAFRRAMKRAMQTTMKMGAIGIKVMTSGRLNGVDIARSEWYREGRVPLHTLKANVDYATSEALTTFGIIGVKVWIYKGDLNLAKNKFVKPIAIETEEVQKPHRRTTPVTKKAHDISAAPDGNTIKMAKLVKQIATAEVMLEEKEVDKGKAAKSVKKSSAAATKVATATTATAAKTTAAKAAPAGKKTADDMSVTAIKVTAAKAKKTTTSSTTRKVAKKDAAAK